MFFSLYLRTKGIYICLLAFRRAFFVEASTSPILILLVVSASANYNYDYFYLLPTYEDYYGGYYGHHYGGYDQNRDTYTPTVSYAAAPAIS
ncbi:hypothetical protein AVEN_36260-1 [Araneus ventricosus]|uniref:Uncharacterized protein n=1 Tax=Araneus ventricosus TaxID=182803 RepID=A0A4Y2NXP9_ARAVE|nr:hypothetical protein AVEN_36260-1 [Araneus ventricosus]